MHHNPSFVFLTLYSREKIVGSRVRAREGIRHLGVYSSGERVHARQRKRRPFFLRCSVTFVTQGSFGPVLMKFLLTNCFVETHGGVCLPS